MSEPEQALARIESLIRIGTGLAMSTTSGKIVLAKAAAVIDRSWIPGALSPALGAALDAATAAVGPPLPIAEVEEILCEAWGARRVRDELDSLDPEPVAVTFTSQVHRGTLEGKPVAVKVLRPGMASAFRQDLALLDTLIAPLSVAFPELDPAALLGEARERVLDELDLENEGQLMRRFHRSLRGGILSVPAPVTELCTDTVLVCSWLEGAGLTSVLDGSGPDVDHDLIAASLVRFFIGGVREGIVHCDLEAADVRIVGDAHLGVLDFGAAAFIERGRADLFIRLIEAYAARDAAALDAALVALGVLESGHGELALALAQRFLGPLGESAPSRLDADSVHAALRRLEGAEHELVELVLAARIVPADLYPARGLGQLFALIARLGATGAWREQLLSALREGWRS